MPRHSTMSNIRLKSWAVWSLSLSKTLSLSLWKHSTFRYHNFYPSTKSSWSTHSSQEAELEQWVADHPEYSASQLRAVVQVIVLHHGVTLDVILPFRGWPIQTAVTRPSRSWTAWSTTCPSRSGDRIRKWTTNHIKTGHFEVKSVANNFESNGT